MSLLATGLPEVCDGGYEIVSDDDPGLDREVVLTTLPVLGSERTRLAGPLRTALWVRVAADVGVVDFVSTHLASSSDDRPCDASTCPPPCEVDEMVNACQAPPARRAFAEEVAADDAVVVLAGDLNARPGRTGHRGRPRRPATSTPTSRPATPSATRRPATSAPAAASTTP